MIERKETKKETLFAPVIGRVILIFAQRQAPFSRSRPPPTLSVPPHSRGLPGLGINMNTFAKRARWIVHLHARNPGHARTAREGKRERPLRERHLRFRSHGGSTRSLPAFPLLSSIFPERVARIPLYCATRHEGGGRADCLQSFSSVPDLVNEESQAKGSSRKNYHGAT